MDILHQLHTPEGLQELIRWGGYVLLFCIIFAETGLLIGFFLPGDSLLFTAAFVVSVTPGMNIWVLIAVLIVAAVLGDATGYYIGRTAGVRLYNRPNSRLFKREHLERTHEFYEKHGAKTIVLARFVPIVRTFAPTVAGAAGMEYRQFVTYNVLGGIGWVTSMCLLGYYLGQVPIIRDNLEKAIILIVVLSILPMVLHWLGERAQQKARLAEAAAALREAAAEAD